MRRWHAISWFLPALITLLLMGACDNAGGGGDGPPLSPTNIDYLEFTYYGESSVGSGAYNTDVFASDGGGDGSKITEFVYLWLNDSSPGGDLDEATYRPGDMDDPNSIVVVEIVVGISSNSFAYAASPAPRENYQNAYPGVSIGTYDQLVDGELTITRAGSDYTFNWCMQCADGDSPRGSFTGSVDDYIDDSSISSQSGSPLQKLSPAVRRRGGLPTW